MREVGEVPFDQAENDRHYGLQSAALARQHADTSDTD